MYHYVIIKAHCTDYGYNDDGRPKRHYKHDIESINEYAKKGYRVHSFFGNYNLDTIMEAKLLDEEKIDLLSV